MVLVDNFFVFLGLLFFALLLLCVTWCALWRLCMTFLECWRRLGVFSGIWGVPVKLQIAVSRASLMFQRGFPDAVGT